MHYSNLLHQTRLGLAIGGDVPWLWPAFETLHFVGMALLIGCVGALDLRILGVGKALPFSPMHRLVPWGILGFAINFTTGVGFYLGNPSQYQSWAFAAKVLFILLAGANAVLFYTTGLKRQLDPIGAGEDAPFNAKVMAMGSLFLWFGVIFWGRMLSSFTSFF